MHRRQFFQTAGGAVTLAEAALAQHAKQNGNTQKTSSSKVKMHCGTQHSDKDDVLTVMSSLGVNHICSTEISPSLDEKWSVDGLSQLKERVEKHGIALDMVPIPLPSAYISKALMGAIMLGESPMRDRQIEQIQQMIRNCAKAGIPAVKYNMSILGVVRIGRTKGRGESTYSTWNYEQAPDKDKLTEAGPVSADAYWERIDYFLARVIPVATEEKVRMACHPHDPAMPEPQGYRGVHTVLGSPAGLKKFVAMHESPYHGLNFCQGTVSEMLKDPNKEIHDVIRYFGTRRKIFNVHFRNIHGGFGDFQETFPDAGSVNMIDAIRTYQEVGYPYMLMPDHVPVIPGDKGGAQAFAFAFGYIQALIQMLG
jgi:mannonate dehydratase